MNKTFGMYNNLQQHVNYIQTINYYDNKWNF